MASEGKKKTGFFSAFPRFGKENQENQENQKTKEGKAIGIDLGTTNTVFGIKGVYTEVLKNAEREELTPSCVIRRNKEYVAGRNALDWRKQDPENTIVSIKRLMGRSFTNEEVQKIIKEHKISYQIRPLSIGTDHSLAVMLNQKEHTPEQISSLILQKIKRDAETALAEEVTHAVITIPSYFNDKQKHATRAAAASAGFKVQRLLPEPTAAAISFGVDPSRDEDIHTILVYDFGGGTFDISVLTMAEGQFIEQAKGGDMWLGGDDIDHLLMEYVYSLIEKEYPGARVEELIQMLPLEQKNRFLGELREKVEKAKIQLSEKEKAYFDILGILKDEDGDIMDVEVEITRPQFEKLILSMVERSIQLMEDVLRGLHFTPEMIDKILLVGGSSCIPLVQQKVREKFGADKVMIHKRPMLSVSEGASILAHRLSENYECPGCGNLVTQNDHECKSCGFDLDKYLIETGVVDIVHSAAHDYYIYLENNPRHLLVGKNTPLPVKKPEVFQLIDIDQKLVHLKFFNLVNEKEESIGDLWLSIEEEEKEEEKKTEEKKEAIKPEIICHFQIDENNIIEVSARIKDQPKIQVSRTLSRGKADEKLFLSLEDTIRSVNSAKHSIYAVHDFIDRSANIIQTINTIVDSETGEIREDVYHQARKRLDMANKFLEKDDSPQGVINYVKGMLLNWRTLINAKGAEKLEAMVKKLEQSNRSAPYEKIIELKKKLSDEISNHPLVMVFMELDRAYSFYQESNSPVKAERILTYMDNMRISLENNDFKKFEGLRMEIMPELLQVAQLEESQTLRIEKGISK